MKELPLVKALTMDGAVRVSDYSNFGTAVTWKSGIDYAMNDSLRFRGSHGTGFRAPHLAQQWFSSTATNFIGGVPYDNKTFPVADPVAQLPTCDQCGRIVYWES